MKKFMNILLAGVVLIASPLHAENLQNATPDQLQQAAIEAVNENDRNELMDIMREMQRREMHFFRAPRSALCEREPEKVGYIAERFGRFGTARQAYFTYLRETAMRDGVCSCLMGQMSFDEFLTEKFGFVQADLDEENYILLRDYRQERQYDVADEYRSFYATNCRKNN